VTRDVKLPEGLLSVPSAAALLGVSSFTLRKWLRQRRIGYVRLGRRVLLAPSALDRFVSEGTVRPRS
jgi:excisionase family DNA binding protein